MTRLRDEVRSAFERQQVALGEVGGSRDRLLQSALANRGVPASRGLQWAAGVAAVLIAATLIATFAIAKAGSHTHAVPASTPSPKALTNTLSVPDSTPLILYRDPAKPDQLDGVTWDGKSAGKMGHQLAGGGNPQNNLFADGTSIVDRSGNVVMTGTFGAKFFEGTWADDGRNICQMVPFSTVGGAGVPTTLQLVTVGQGVRDVAKVGTLHEQTVVRVAACSTLTDRAVVVQSGGQGMGTVGVWVVQLSTGKVLWTHRYDVTETNAHVVASRDGMYVAENLTQSGAAGSTIYGPAGNPAAALSEWVEAFSWDGSLAVVDAGQGDDWRGLMSWGDGRIAWAGPYHNQFLAAHPEPGGAAMAIWLAPSPGLSPQSQTPDLYIVSASGDLVLHITGTASLP